MSDLDPRQDPRLAWIFAEPDPAAVVAGMKESALTALAATSSPPGYGVAPVTEAEGEPSPYVSIYLPRRQAVALERALASVAEGKAASNPQQRALVAVRKALARRPRAYR